MGLERDVELLGMLVEPQRRRVYGELLAARSARTLSELAQSLGLGRTLTAFHLTKLVDAGLVEVVAAQAGEGRRGRPSQRYRVGTREVSASVPPRHYDVVASVLLEAASDQQPDEAIADAALRIAQRVGAEQAREDGGSRRTATMRRAERLLTELGYSPAREEGRLVLRNCPFDKLRDSNLPLVCGINHALAQGYLDGLGVADELTADLRPCPDNCCVVVGPRT